MATETEEYRPAVQPEEEEEEGGPVKPFLDHLEDLRWVLIKCLVALGVSFLVCIMAGNQVVTFLMRPLQKTSISYPSDRQIVTLRVGTNKLATFQFNRSQPEAQLFGTNQFLTLQLQPVQVGTNWVLGLKPVPSEGADARHPLDIQVINLGPASAFMVALKIGLYAGLVVAAPFIFYFVGSFVFPALKKIEKKYATRALIFGGGLFLCGAAFCYYGLMPLILVAAAKYAEWLGFTATQWRAEDYVGFVTKLMLGMGVGFELPVLILTLVKLGIFSAKQLASNRPYVVVFNLVLAAILTPPDVFSQVMLALPMQVLFELSVAIAYYWEWRDRRREAAEAAGQGSGAA